MATSRLPGPSGSVAAAGIWPPSHLPRFQRSNINRRPILRLGDMAWYNTVC
jgi:hypothetical protein